MAEFDRSSKWLIEHHGDALLSLAGVRDIVSWRPLQAELVQTGQLPDGLLEVVTTERPDPDLYVVEIATYPEQRLVRQLVRDALLVYLNRDVLPEVFALILHPKGRLEIPSHFTAASAAGWAELNLRWRVVELWQMNAEDLLAVGDPGLAPWIPLTQFSGPPEAIFQRCREVIEQTPSEDERANLLAVTQVLAGLRYNDVGLFRILGGRNAMIESPVLRELEDEWKARYTAEGKAEGKAEGVAEGMVEAIRKVLRARFGDVPEALDAAILGHRDHTGLDLLLAAAAKCVTLDEFRAQLPS